MGLSEQLTADERERWESFFQRLGASLRTASMLKVLDSQDPLMTSEALACASNILQNELTIVVLHKHRGVLSV